MNQSELLEMLSPELLQPIVYEGCPFILEGDLNLPPMNADGLAGFFQAEDD